MMFSEAAILIFGCAGINKDQKAPVLNLSGKQLDSIPSYVFKNKHLKELYLGPSDMTIYGSGAVAEHKNNITQLTAQICKLSKLKKLDLTYNNLTSLKNIECLVQLETLNIAFNSQVKFMDYLPSIMKLKSLKTFVLVGTNYGPGDIEKLRKQLPASVTLISRFSEYIDYLKQISRKGK